MNDKSTVLPLEKLEAERTKTQRELARLYSLLKNELDPNVEEAAVELSERGIILSLIREETRKLQEIDHALQYMRQGEYGICERCSQPIDPERLAAVPETTFCFECKVVVERTTRARTSS